MRTTRSSAASASATQAGRDDVVDVPLGLRSLQIGHHLTSPGALRSDGARQQVLARDARQAEQVVDQQRHALGGGAHALQVLQIVGVQAVAGVLDDIWLKPSIARSGARRS